MNEAKHMTANDTTKSQTTESDSDSTSSPHRWAGMMLFIAAGYLLVAVLPLVVPNWWFADLLANLRVQLVIAAGLLLLGLFMTRCWKTVFPLIVLTLYHVSWFVNPTLVSAMDANSSTAITVMAANVFTGNQQFELIERQFRDSDCDVVVVSELSFELVQYFRRGFTKDYPYHLEAPADRGNFGIGIYSRAPLENASIEYLLNDSIPTVFADVRVNGNSFHIVGVHTLPPMGMQMFEHRNRHLQLVADHVRKRQKANAEQAVIVMGDLNLTPWSPIFQRFLNSGHLRQAVDGNMLQPTWYHWPIFPFGLVLDHVLLSDKLVCGSRTIGKFAGSDHRFVTVEVGLSSAD